MKNVTSVMRLLAVSVLIFVLSAGSEEESVKTITAEDLYDSFIYEDFVVEGTVESIVEEKVPMEDLTPSVRSKVEIPMARINFRVSRVLIGDLDKSEITVVGMTGLRQDYAFDLEVGDRYLLALMFWDRGKYHKRGAYILRRDDSRFLIKENTWFRGRKDEHISTGRLPDLYSALEEIKRMRSIETLTREAELIVRGTVVDVWESDERTEPGRSKNIQCVKLKVSSRIKGDLKDDVLIFKMIPKGRYQPFWWSRVPDMNTGEEWYVFLKWAEEPGYYPFAGVNGMFRIEGDELIRDNHNRVVLKGTPDSLEETIAREVSGGGDRDER